MLIPALGLLGMSHAVTVKTGLTSTEMAMSVPIAFPVRLVA